MFEPLSDDEVDEVLASIRPRDESERRMRHEAAARIAARRDAEREDRSLAERLDEMKEMRNAAVRLLKQREYAMRDALALPEEEHPAATVLRAAVSDKS